MKRRSQVLLAPFDRDDASGSSRPAIPHPLNPPVHIDVPLRNPSNAAQRSDYASHGPACHELQLDPVSALDALHKPDTCLAIKLSSSRTHLTPEIVLQLPPPTYGRRQRPRHAPPHRHPRG